MSGGQGGGSARAGLAAMAVAAAGVILALAGRHLGNRLLEDVLGPAVTLLGAALWVGFRAWKGRGR